MRFIIAMIFLSMSGVTSANDFSKEILDIYSPQLKIEQEKPMEMPATVVLRINVTTGEKSVHYSWEALEQGALVDDSLFDQTEEFMGIPEADDTLDAEETNYLANINRWNGNWHYNNRYDHSYRHRYNNWHPYRNYYRPYSSFRYPYDRYYPNRGYRDFNRHRYTPYYGYHHGNHLYRFFRDVIHR